MILVSSAMRNKKLPSICLGFMKWWHLIWMFLSAVSFLGFLIYDFDNSSFEISKSMFFVHISLFLKSFLYYKASRLLKDILINESKTETFYAKMISLGFSFICLFILSLISLLNGKFYSSTASASKMFLKVLPEGSSIHEVYSKIYLYIPATFDFIKPHAEGTALFIIAVVCFNISGRKNELLS